MVLALQKFGEALVIERDCFDDDDHPTCARTLNEIGNIELQLGNREEVMRCIYRKAGASDDRLVVYGRRLWRFELIRPEAAAAP